MLCAPHEVALHGMWSGKRTHTPSPHPLHCAGKDYVPHPFVSGPPKCCDNAYHTYTHDHELAESLSKLKSKFMGMQSRKMFML